MAKKASKKEKTEFDFKKIDTVEKAFKHLDIPVISADDLDKVDPRFREPLMGLYNLMVATEACNNGENLKLDYTKSSQNKHAPWYDLSSGSVRFDGSGYYWTDAGAIFGPRFCSKNSAISDYIGKTFISEAEKVLK